MLRDRLGKNFFAPLNRKDSESVLPSPGPPMPTPAPAMPTAGHKEAADKESTGLDKEADVPTEPFEEQLAVSPLAHYHVHCSVCASLIDVACTTPQEIV